ncbi:PDZ domain-containing protein [Trichonephila clavata]|uniref:PDZ domain-containing protein n=1 Tax=Trichonephila clavata TaxID=2740835 RepID=A0A8X6J7C9_TRICU|nr:PDZ domain-containing protein [Trichonephila clavata]
MRSDQPTAFDNPYFRNSQQVDDPDGDKGKIKFPTNTKNSLRSSKSEGKTRKGKNPFMFKKQKAMDDSCITHAEPERTVVSLRGHDFTGLGFNIMGNMRDGILVKDVLHRGPASESGLIKAGDKIVSVTVSFSSIVYEDALTILSYASPYDVRLEIERMAPSSSGGPRRLGSCSFSHSGQKLFHPLYRSQSIYDLTQIDREGRSQSAGGAAGSGSGTQGQHRLATEALSTTGSLNEKMLANVMAEGHWKKKFEDTFESDDPAPQGEVSSRRYPDGSSTEYRQEVLKVDIEEVPRRPTDAWQGSEGESLSSTREEISVVQNLSARNKTTRTEEDNNDSDVSKDSLEISVKRKALRRSPVTIPKSQYAFTNTVQIESPSSRIHDNTGKSLIDREGKQLERTNHHPRAGLAESVDTSRMRVDTYRSTSKPFQGERQKLNNSDASVQSYGSRTQVYNGGADRQPESDDKKFAKTPAAGMFTQINPFQMPSNKQRHCRPWGAREDVSKPPPRLASAPKFTLRDSPMQNRQF